jgi:hypothetical protein
MLVGPDGTVVFGQDALRRAPSPLFRLVMSIPEAGLIIFHSHRRQDANQGHRTEFPITRLGRM